MTLNVLYLYDVPDWALHNLGKVLAEHLNGDDLTITCMQSSHWHEAPCSADVLYFSYSNLFRLGFPYSDWCPEMISTIHDPFEISHREDSLDWIRGPFLRRHFEKFDRISTSSQEMLEILNGVYQLHPYLTPTWPTHRPLSADSEPRDTMQRLRLISSTSLGEFYPLRDILGRFRSRHALWHYTHKEDGTFSLRQLRGLAVIRRRKNIRLMRQIRKHFSGRPEIDCQFRFGRGSPVGRDLYEHELGKADVYICTSNMEGGPLPVLEAVSLGLAVVSTPVGQVEEWVHDAKNGRICRSLRDFIAAIESYAADRAMLAAHQEASRKIASQKVFPLQQWKAFLSGAPQA